MLKQPDLGLMLTPHMGNAPDLTGTHWGADNGCFAAPEKFNAETYISWLRARKRFAAQCLFATAPDVLGDAVATIAKSRTMFHSIRTLGFKVGLVGQDGLESIPVPWDEFDCLFIGGTTEWKLSEPAYELAQEAKGRGKWVHMGRVNSWRRLKAAAISGFDSADGTYLAFGPDTNLPRLMGWMQALRLEPPAGLWA